MDKKMSEKSPQRNQSREIAQPDELSEYLSTFESLIKSTPDMAGKSPDVDSLLASLKSRSSVLQEEMRAGEQLIGEIVDPDSLKGNLDLRRVQLRLAELEMEIDNIDSLWVFLGGPKIDETQKEFDRLNNSNELSHQDRLDLFNDRLEARNIFERNAKKLYSQILDYSQDDPAVSANENNDLVIEVEPRADISQKNTEHEEGSIASVAPMSKELVVIPKISKELVSIAEAGTSGESDVEAQLKSATEAYAEAKVAVEIKGGADGFWRIGGRKREAQLQLAEEALFKAQKQNAEAVVNGYKIAGRYNNPEAVGSKQQEDDDFFNRFRELDSEARKLTLQKRLQSVEERGRFAKAAAAVGKFLNGGKGKGWLRNAVPGALLGAGTVLSGAGWPITAVAGLAAGRGVFLASKMGYLDSELMKQSEALNPDQKNDNFMVSEDKFNLLRHVAESNSGVAVNRDAQAKNISEGLFRISREAGDKVLTEARQKAKENLKKFGIGFAVGGVAAGVGRFATSIDYNAGQVPAVNGDEGTTDTVPNVVAPNNDVLPKGPDLTPGAATISSGEGFFHQFADMGLNSGQANELMADKGFMNRLVEMGAAYKSSAPGLNGYGINYPSGGKWSAEVMSFVQEEIARKFN